MKKNVSFWEENIARVSMVGVGVVCVGLSIWYTRLFFIRDSELPALIATLLSAVIAIFNSFALAAATFLLHHKKYFMAVIFIPIWLSTTAFDIFTVAGSQSYRFQILNQEMALSDQTSLNDDLKYSLLQAELASRKDYYEQINADLKDENNRYASYAEDLRKLQQERSSYIEDAPPPTLLNSINRIQPQVNASRARVEALRQEQTNSRQSIEEANDNIRQYITEQDLMQGERLAAMPKKISFANWIHDIFPSIQVQHIQFVLAIIPAFFIDLISPIAMSFGLTLAKDLERNQSEPIPKPPEPLPPTKRRYTKRKKEEPMEEEPEEEEEEEYNEEEILKKTEEKIEEEIKERQEKLNQRIELAQLDKPNLNNRIYTKAAVAPVIPPVKNVLADNPAPFLTEYPKPIIREDVLEEIIPVPTNIIVPQEEEIKETPKIEEVKKDPPIAIKVAPDKTIPLAYPKSTKIETKMMNLPSQKKIEEQPEVKIKEEPFVVSDDNKVVYYRFGKTTKKTGRLMRNLIDEIYKLADAKKEFNIEELRKQTSLTERAFYILWNKLNAASIGGDILFTPKRGEQNTFVYNFNKQVVIDFMLEEIQHQQAH